jgi:hypothetical protein
MISNGIIGESSKIATVEIRLKCSARTPAHFVNAESQPQTGLGDYARRKYGKRRNAVVALRRSRLLRLLGRWAAPGRDAASGPTVFEIVQKPFYLSECCRMVRG